ncbi:1-phosphofructokinase family hexose kinase [Halovulum sp. GXIMD14793]
MRDILTLTLNPSIDLSTYAPKVTAGPKLRCAAPEVAPGGGGINVARAIRILGGPASALVAAGGANGARLVELLQAEGIEVHCFDAPGDTRESLAVTDSSTGEQYRFVLPGPEWAEDDITRLMNRTTDLAPSGSIVVLSGSQPPGISATFPARLAAALLQRDVKLVIDTSGSALEALVADQTVTPYLLRMDNAEAVELAGHPLPTRQNTARFARRLVEQDTAEIVIMARGAEGSVLVDADRALHCTAADVPVISAVGAGDSFVGALVLALASGADRDRALQDGCIAASSAVMTEGTRLCRRSDMTDLRPQCRLSEIDDI